MTTDKRVLILIYEMSAKEIEGYIKQSDDNVQTWVIIVRADQTKGTLKALQSNEICVRKSLETERATFQASDIEFNLRWTPDRNKASPCLER